MAEQRCHRIVMIGATGAVGGHVAQTLVDHPSTPELVILGRRLADVEGPKVAQHIADLEAPEDYIAHLAGAHTAICTVGVGEPSKVDREVFIRIDKTLVLDFARACKEAGVVHFLLLSSVSADPTSHSFFLRIKGELEAGLRQLEFDRLSLFHPSMLMTPTNRYGFAQGVVLSLWPTLSRVMRGATSKYRSIDVAVLGRAMAAQACQSSGAAEETLYWDAFNSLAGVTI